MPFITNYATVAENAPAHIAHAMAERNRQIEQHNVDAAGRADMFANIATSIGGAAYNEIRRYQNDKAQIAGEERDEARTIRREGRIEDAQIRREERNLADDFYREQNRQFWELDKMKAQAELWEQKERTKAAIKAEDLDRIREEQRRTSDNILSKMVGMDPEQQKAASSLIGPLDAAAKSGDTKGFTAAFKTYLDATRQALTQAQKDRAAMDRVKAKPPPRGPQTATPQTETERRLSLLNPEQLREMSTRLIEAPDPNKPGQKKMIPHPDAYKAMAELNRQGAVQKQQAEEAMQLQQQAQPFVEKILSTPGITQEQLSQAEAKGPVEAAAIEAAIAELDRHEQALTEIEQTAQYVMQHTGGDRARANREIDRLIRELGLTPQQVVEARRRVANRQAQGATQR